MKRTIALLVALFVAALVLAGCELGGPGYSAVKATAVAEVKAQTATPTPTPTSTKATEATPALMQNTATPTATNTPTPPVPTHTPTTAPAQAKIEAVPCEQLPATYSKPPQPQVGHPSFYIETGIPNKRCWVVTINDGFTAVVGGFSIDDKTNGVYSAILGPRTVTVTVENGFVAIPVNSIAREEFCFRLGQAVQYKWAHDNVYPLANWASCPSDTTSATKPATTPQTNAGVRTATGKGDKTLPFPAGASVAGFLVKLDDGRSCNQCFVKKAPVSGTVTDGVIWPWPEEVVGLAEPNW